MAHLRFGKLESGDPPQGARSHRSRPLEPDCRLDLRIRGLAEGPAKARRPRRVRQDPRSGLMPELPDLTIYVEQLERRLAGRPINRARIVSHFFVRSFDPPVEIVEGKTVLG